MLSVVVPCYNEEKNILLLGEKFAEVAKKDTDCEIIFVNNGSTDSSENVFRTLSEKYKEYPFEIVTVSVNQGYGHGILKGLEHAKGELLAWTHADLQTDPLDLLRGRTLFEQSPDNVLLVKGKRKNRNFLDVFFTWGMEVFASVALATHLNDINAQPKIFSRPFYQKIRQEAPKDFALDLYFLYMATKNGHIIDFPVLFTNRLHGEAKGGGTLKGKYKLTKRTISYIMEMRRSINSKGEFHLNL